MIEIAFQQPQWVELVPQHANLKGVAGRGPVVSPGRVSLGTPIGQPLNEELAANDIALKNLLRHNVESAFHFVQLACSFMPEKATTFTSVNLRAQLRHAAPAPEKPIAMALIPSTTGEQGSGDIGAGVEATLGVVKFKVDGKQSEKWTKLTIVPFGLQTSLAGWELRETKLSPIEGIFAFALVVKSIRGVPVQVRASLSAVATETKFAFVHHDTAVSADPLTITLRS
jgi:hypothetical protein